MQKPFKIIFSVLLFFLFFSCEQHYFFLNKVKVNTDEISLKNVKRLPQQSLYISKNTDSNIIAAKSTIAQNEISKNDSRAVTPKAFYIKRLSVPDVKVNKIKIRKTPVDEKNTNDNLPKIIIGILFIVIGVILLLIGILIFITSEGSSYGCSPILSIIFGIISLIFGLGLAFINY